MVAAHDTFCEVARWARHAVFRHEPDRFDKSIGITTLFKPVRACVGARHLQRSDRRSEQARSPRERTLRSIRPRLDRVTAIACRQPRLPLRVIQQESQARRVIEARSEPSKVAAACHRPVLFVAVRIANHGVEQQVAGEHVPRREGLRDTHRRPHAVKRLAYRFEGVTGAVSTHDRLAKEFIAVQQRFALRQDTLADHPETSLVATNVGCEFDDGCRDPQALGDCGSDPLGPVVALPVSRAVGSTAVGGVLQEPVLR